MREEIFWVVYEEEKKTRKWVDMPKDYIGSPLYEHATDYITVLETGERVMVRKKDGYVFENSGVSSSDKSHLATPDEIEKLRADARRKAEERRRKGLQRGEYLSPHLVGGLAEPSEDGSWQVVKANTKGRWVPMPKNYQGKPILEYWNVYITELESGERVYINKRTGKVVEDTPNSRMGIRNNTERKQREIGTKTISVDKLVKNEYDKTAPWVVDLDSSKRNRWYPMPIDFKGKPTFESWDSYVTKLSDGSKVAISKRTNEVVVEGSPQKAKLVDRGSSKHKPKDVAEKKTSTERVSKSAETSEKSDTTYTVGVSPTPQRAVSSGLKVISSKEELLELQAKSLSSTKETTTKKKGVKADVTTS